MSLLTEFEEYKKTGALPVPEVKEPEKPKRNLLQKVGDFLNSPVEKRPEEEKVEEPKKTLLEEFMSGKKTTTYPEFVSLEEKDTGLRYSYPYGKYAIEKGLSDFQQKQIEAKKLPKAEISEFKGEIPVDRAPEPYWKKIVKAILPLQAEQFFGLDKPEEELSQKELLMKKYDEAYAFEDLKQLRSDIEDGRGRLPRKTTGEVFEEGAKDPGKYLPFVSAIPDIKEAYNLYKAAKRVEEGKETNVDIYLLAKY